MAEYIMNCVQYAEYLRADERRRDEIELMIAWQLGTTFLRGRDIAVVSPAHELLFLLTTALYGPISALAFTLSEAFDHEALVPSPHFLYIAKCLLERYDITRKALRQEG